MKELFEAGLAFKANTWPLDSKNPTLFFIHASGCSGILWDNQLKGLGDRINAIALDLPGHGRSPGAGYQTIPEYTHSVMNFIDRLNPPRPIPAGLSLGGAITLQLLIDQPNRFPAAILLCTGARMKILPQMLEAIEKDFTASVALSKQVSVSPKTDPALIQPSLEDILNCRPAVAFGDFKACDRFDVRDRLHEIMAKVLVVTGEDDVFTPPKFGKYLAEHIPGAQWVNVPDAGHLLPVEKPDELNQAIIDFLDQSGL
jgi:pimeloyl-ACP methyl ester carboxylesterase